MAVESVLIWGTEAAYLRGAGNLIVSVSRDV